MFNKTVECHECKHIVRREVAQEIPVRNSSPRFFCSEHKKNYDLIKPNYSSAGLLYGYHLVSSYNFYKEIEVDEQGEPKGYVKEVQKDVVQILTEALAPKRGRGRPKKR